MRTAHSLGTLSALLAWLGLTLLGCGGDEPYGGGDRGQTLGDGSLVATAYRAPAGGTAEVAAPDFVMNLDATGKLLHDIKLPGQGESRNGIGVPAAPAAGDLDGDGQLEIAVLTFDHRVDVFTVPGSQANCAEWTTGRGNLLRDGQGPAYAQ